MAIISFLLYVHIALVFSVLFLIDEFSASRAVLLAPDVLAGVILIIAFLHASRRSDLVIPGKYIIWMLMLAGVILVGIVANQVQPGAVFWGIRKLFRYLPLFLLPILVDFPLKTRLNHFRVYLLFALAQLPIALYQFVPLINYKGEIYTGDPIRGTLLSSGTLTVFLLGVCLVWTAAYVKRSINLATYVIVMPFLFIPTLLNETTAALVLLPVAIAMPFFLNKRKSVMQLFVVGGVATLMMFVFISVYSTYHTRWGGDVTNALTERGTEYLYRGADENSRADGGRGQSEIGRVDSMLMPFIVHDDPLQWLVGVGVGNASGTSNEVLRGEYFDFNERYGIDFTTYTHLLWEIGILGLALIVLFLWFIFRDGRAESVENGADATLSLAAVAMVPYIGLAMAYTNLINDIPTVVGLSLLFGNLVWIRSRSGATDTQSAVGQTVPQIASDLRRPWLNPPAHSNIHSLKH